MPKIEVVFQVLWKFGSGFMLNGLEMWMLHITFRHLSSWKLWMIIRKSSCCQPWVKAFKSFTKAKSTFQKVTQREQSSGESHLAAQSISGISTVGVTQCGAGWVVRVGGTGRDRGREDMERVTMARKVSGAEVYWASHVSPGLLPSRPGFPVGQARKFLAPLFWFHPFPVVSLGAVCNPLIPQWCHCKAFNAKLWYRLPLWL